MVAQKEPFSARAENGSITMWPVELRLGGGGFSGCAQLAGFRPAFSIRAAPDLPALRFYVSFTHFFDDIIW